MKKNRTLKVENIPFLAPTVAEVPKKKEVVIEYRAWCHLCKPPKGYTTINELQQHTVREHRVYKG